MSVDRWQDEWGADRYLLPDGTNLLWVRKPMGPENVVNGRENVQDLDETARALAWFENRGLLYDTERAYALYRTCQKNGERYQAGLVEQTIVPVPSNRRMDLLCDLCDAAAGRGADGVWNLAGNRF